MFLKGYEVIKLLDGQDFYKGTRIDIYSNDEEKILMKTKVACDADKYYYLVNLEDNLDVSSSMFCSGFKFKILD